MKLRRLVVTLALFASVFVLLAIAPRGVTPPAPVVLAAPEQAAPHCVPVGGMIMTNLIVADPPTTLGTATGDLRGAVSASILNVSAGANGTTVFTVQHHFVTEAGDTVTVAPAMATVAPVGPGLVAVVSYPLQITGGTGKFASATGTLQAIGEVSLPNSPGLAGLETGFRYSGQVCFAARQNP
jgi:hypothetical protein